MGQAGVIVSVEISLPASDRGIPELSRGVPVRRLILKTQSGRPRGCGIVEFETEEMAEWRRFFSQTIIFCNKKHIFSLKTVRGKPSRASTTPCYRPSSFVNILGGVDFFGNSGAADGRRIFVRAWEDRAVKKKRSSATRKVDKVPETQV